MIILLVTILAIALCFIVAGLLLSPRTSEPPTRGVPFSARAEIAARRSDPAVRRSAQTKRLHRSYIKVKPNSRANSVEYFNIGHLFHLSGGAREPWIGLTLVLIALFCFGLFLLRTLLPGSAMIVAASWPDVAAAAPPPVSSKSVPSVDPFANLSGASKALIRLNQLDRGQYNSQQDYDTWAYSTCSAAAMAAVINAYGHTYHVADILKVEAGLHEITPDLGLVEPVGIDRTAAQFGFQTYWLNKPSLDDLLKVANQGHPVIIGFPPDRWSGGHILIVSGGDSKYVYLADSSRLNMQAMARDTFIKYWAGFAAVMMPK
jgi:Peptidase_C39 like family